MTKTIKIPEKVHTELKSYVAVNKVTIDEFAGMAIMEKLKQSGHKFVYPEKKSKK
jgi:hypothetical protein